MKAFLLLLEHSFLWRPNNNIFIFDKPHTVCFVWYSPTVETVHMCMHHETETNKRNVIHSLKVGQIICYVYTFKQWNNFHKIVYTLSSGHRIFFECFQLLFCVNFVIQFIKYEINEKQPASYCFINERHCIALYKNVIVLGGLSEFLEYTILATMFTARDWKIKCAWCVTVKFIFISFRLSCNQHHWFVTHFHFVQYSVSFMRLIMCGCG